MKKRKEVKTVSLPYYGVMVLWFLFIVLNQLNKISLAMILSVAVFTLLRVTEHDSVSLHKSIKSDSNANSAIQRGYTAIHELRYIMDQIENTDVCKSIGQLEELSGKILKQVEEQPEKESKIEKFVDYYLPTTLKVLHAYRRAEAAGIEGENISRAKKQIKTMLDSSILAVFNKQLDSLFGSDALDISAELSALEQIMKQEGISGEKLEAETTTNADGTDIKLTL